MATAGHPQVRAGKHVEPGIVTSGDALGEVAQFLPPGAEGYSAADVVRTDAADREATGSDRHVRTAMPRLTAAQRRTSERWTPKTSHAAAGVGASASSRASSGRSPSCAS